MGVATPVTTSTLVQTGTGMLRGVSLRSTAGGTFDVYDNTSAAGTVICTVQLAANGSQTVVIPDGVRFGIGCYFSASAACVGSVWT